MSALAVDAGLLQRMRDAGRAIVWEEAPGRPGAARVARLREERARVVRREHARSVELEVTAGPVGSLVVLLEADGRGAPSSLGSRNAGRDPGFPDGSIVAVWGPSLPAADATPTVRDLVELARYALL